MHVPFEMYKWMLYVTQGNIIYLPLIFTQQKYFVSYINMNQDYAKKLKDLIGKVKAQQFKIQMFLAHYESFHSYNIKKIYKAPVEKPVVLKIFLKKSALSKIRLLRMKSMPLYKRNVVRVVNNVQRHQRSVTKTKILTPPRQTRV